MEIRLRKATEKDLERISVIMVQAVDQMLREGKNQWDRTYPLPEHIRADIDRGVAYVLVRAEEPTVNEAAPETIMAYGAIVYDGEPAYDALDGKWLSDQPYVVVHRIAVADEFKRQGVATRFMRETERQAVAAGVHSFRIDTNYDNFYMMKMLANLGFTYTGECQYSRGSRHCYEKLI